MELLRCWNATAVRLHSRLVTQGAQHLVAVQPRLPPYPSSRVLRVRGPAPQAVLSKWIRSPSAWETFMTVAKLGFPPADRAL